MAVIETPNTRARQPTALAINGNCHSPAPSSAHQVKQTYYYHYHYYYNYHYY